MIKYEGGKFFEWIVCLVDERLIAFCNNIVGETCTMSGYLILVSFLQNKQLFIKRKYYKKFYLILVTIFLDKQLLIFVHNFI